MQEDVKVLVQQASAPAHVLAIARAPPAYPIAEIIANQQITSPFLAAKGEEDSEGATAAAIAWRGSRQGIQRLRRHAGARLVSPTSARHRKIHRYFGNNPQDLGSPHHRIMETRRPTIRWLSTFSLMPALLRNILPECSTRTAVF
jgi:hypothetical protein